MKLTFTEENYLKAILRLETRGDKITTNAISRELATKASSVTDMLKKLSVKKLVNHSKYKPVSLLTAGRKVALQVVRKHRLWEVFLVEKLGFKWNEVHLIAEQLEHIDSEKLVDRLDHFLGNPLLDPHGDPIPGPDGKMRLLPSASTLDTCKASQKLSVIGVKNSSDEFLRFLDELGIHLGTVLVLIKVFDFDRSVEVEMPNKKRVILNKSVSHNLLVKDLPLK